MGPTMNSNVTYNNVINNYPACPCITIAERLFVIFMMASRRWPDPDTHHPRILSYRFLRRKCARTARTTDIRKALMNILESSIWSRHLLHLLSAFYLGLLLVFLLAPSLA